MRIGDERMKDSLLFLSLARNCAKTIPRFLAYLEKLEAHGFNCAAIIGENGSTDGTRRILTQASKADIVLLDTSGMAEGNSRLARMAIGRQALLNAALARGISEDAICVVDLDNVILAPPEPAAVRAAIVRLREEPTLFAIGASSYPVYYDLLSLRISGGNELADLSEKLARAKENIFTYYQFHRDYIYRIQKRYTSLVAGYCKSSFNGMCIYRSIDYAVGSYRSNAESDVCEHVSMNLSIGRKTGKRMFVSPDLILQAPSDHIPVGFARFWIDRVRERMNRIRVNVQ